MIAMAAPWQAVVDRSPGRVLKHPLRARIRQAVERNPGMVPQDLATQLGCNRSTVRYHITRMQAAG
ncbi:MAG TPA: helix-turn-helix domain-containing protein, partial [Candidatus Thermoplasmatota archaeon]|nr:helix-turn-helix domain-containing protein [Candidatus Thermoplasmatota archaeon]